MGDWRKEKEIIHKTTLSAQPEDKECRTAKHSKRKQNNLTPVLDLSNCHPHSLYYKALWQRGQQRGLRVILKDHQKYSSHPKSRKVSGQTRTQTTGKQFQNPGDLKDKA